MSLALQQTATFHAREALLVDQLESFGLVTKVTQTRVRLGPGVSGRVRAVIFKLFRAFFWLIFSMSTQNIFYLFLKIFSLYFLSESVFSSKRSFGLLFFLQSWHNSDVTKKQCVLITLFWAEIGL